MLSQSLRFTASPATSPSPQSSVGCTCSSQCWVFDFLAATCTIASTRSWINMSPGLSTDLIIFHFPLINLWEMETWIVTHDIFPFQGLCSKWSPFPPVQTTAAVSRTRALLLLGYQKDHTWLLCPQLGVYMFLPSHYLSNLFWLSLIVKRQHLYVPRSWVVCFPATAFLKWHNPCGTSTSSRLTPFSSSSLCSSSLSTPSRSLATSCTDRHMITLTSPSWISLSFFGGGCNQKYQILWQQI